MTFTKYTSYIQLKKLAQSPFDLKTDLTPERLRSMKAEALGFKLLYGTERVCSETMKALFLLADESNALNKMLAMQSGEIINKIENFDSENRSVLHTAMRDIFEDRNQAVHAKNASDLALTEIKKLEAFQNRFEPFTDLIQIGIGGSSLGPEAVGVGLEAFHKPNRRIHFLPNVDPDEAAKIFSKVVLSKTIVVVVSKSGTTLETLTNEELARRYFADAGLNPNLHLISVTGKGSPMDDVSRYLESFYIWDFVGGRYSSTSMVGLVMLSFAMGMESVMQFLQGAHEMDKVALRSDIASNLPLLSALLGIWNRNFLGYSSIAIIPYSQALRRLPAHLQQLDMESNGKSFDRLGQALDYHSGPIVWGEPGTNSQHSFFQLLHQGTTSVPIEFISFIQNQYNCDIVVENTTSQQKLLANLIAQSIALAQGQENTNPNKSFSGNRSNSILVGSKLDPFSMGVLLSYYEHKVAFQGFIWNINSFDQEGVQLGKKLAVKLRDCQLNLNNHYPLGEAYLSHFNGD